MIEKNFEIKVEGREFAKILRSQFIIGERSVLQFLKKNAVLNCFCSFSDLTSYIRTIRIQNGRNNWDLEIYRKS